MYGNINDRQCVLIRRLCLSLLAGKKGHLENVYRKAIENLGTFGEAEFQTSFSPIEEHQIIELVVTYMKNKYTNAEEVISRFHSVYKSLQDYSSTPDKNIEMLLCLLRIGEQNCVTKVQNNLSHANEINGNFTISPDRSCGDTINSTAFTSHVEESAAISNCNVVLQNSQKLQSKERFDSPLLRTTRPTHHLYTNTPPFQEPKATSSLQGSCPKNGHHIRLHGDNLSTSESNDSSRPNSLPVTLQFSDPKKSNIMKDFGVTEYEIMKELIFCMQGIDGKIIKYMSIEEGFHLNPCVKLDQEYIIRYLMELGHLHNLIKHYMKSFFIDVGIVAQGLLSAVRRELTDYYQTLANLDSQLNRPPEIADTPLSEEECAKYHLPTLSQLFIWSRKPLEKLRTLCDVLRLVQDKRGGEIVSALAFLSSNGNPRVREIILRLLASAIQPFYKQIFFWVVNGEIIDTHEEFFIKAENHMDSLENKYSWNKRFMLRPSMIPVYMSDEEANQILETGRGMNFLHNICLQRPPMTPAQISLLNLEKNKWNDAKALTQPGNAVSELINSAYIEVSKIVLQTLCEKFKMKTHLEALRKYMLLGQGDFIHHLLEIIEPDLNKPVGTLHTYNLMRSLEDAIYKSNAQFDDADVLKKLWVNTLATSERENFSEAFCLQYKLEGPLNEIFKPSLIMYNRIFTFMWRVKRAHHMVLKMWRGLKLLHKEANKLIPEAKSCFHQVNGLVKEMLNFLNHFGYYIASEVVEVEWRKFQNEMDKMESLEKVLQAHNEFLNSIQTSCMLNDKSGKENLMTMAWHIRSLLDYVQELVPIVETFQILCECELEREKRRQENIAEYGTSVVGEEEDCIATIQFQEEMNKVKTKFKVLANQYQDKLKSLLVLFSKNYDDNDLILLRHRIDFNQFYKQSDNRLLDSLRVYRREF